MYRLGRHLPRFSQLIALVLCAVGGVGGSSCYDPLAPAEVAGRYVLPSPIEVAVTSTHVDSLLAAAFVLLSDGTGYREGRAQRSWETGVSVLDSRAKLTFQLDGRFVVIAELLTVDGEFTLPQTPYSLEYRSGTLITTAGVPMTYTRTSTGAP